MDLLKKLNFIFDKRQKRGVVLLFFVICIGSALELLGVSAILPVISAIMAPDNILEQPVYSWIYTTFHLNSVKTLIVLVLLVLVAIYIIKNAFLIFMYNCQYRFIFENKRILADKMVKCYIDQPYLFHVSKNSAELLRNINEDTRNFFDAVQAGVKLLTELMVCAVLGRYLLIKDKTITLSILCLMTILVFLFFKIYKRYLLQMGAKNRDYMMSMNKWVQQTFGGIKETKILNKEKFFYTKYDEVCREHAKSEYTYHTLLMLPKPIIETACISGMLGAIAIKFWWRGADITYFVPIISVFTMAAFRLMPSFNRITEYLGTIVYQKAAIGSIYKDLKEIEELNAEKQELIKKDIPIIFDKEIEVRNLTFAYPNSEKQVLNNLNLKIEKNSVVAFIGQSGAGKSTLADLLLGILEPSEGGIYVDGVNINQNPYSWHKVIGYIPQTIYLMDDSIRNNIAFGVDEAHIDAGRLEYAVEQAQLTELINELPEGLDTYIGEGGVRLSGGQRQRIGIARALYNNPAILVLDEATSALDNETETAVMEAIEKLQGKKTIIIIAHRLTTIRNADVIYEVGEGNAVIREKSEVLKEC